MNLKTVTSSLTSALWTCKNVLMQPVELLYGGKSEPQVNDAAPLQCSSDDASLEKGTDEVITKLKEDGGPSLEVLDIVLTCMSSLGEKTADSILSFKSKMIAVNNDSYKLVVKEYLSSSLEMLDFFTELEKFLDSARRSHSYMASAVEQCNSLGCENGVGKEEAKTMLKILNSLMASSVNDHSGEKLVEKARSLLEKQEAMFEKCQDEQEKLGKDYKSIHDWKKILNYISMTAKLLVAVVVVVMLVTSARAAWPDVVGNLSFKAACGISFPLSVDKAGQWKSSDMKACENELLMKRHAMKTMQEGALHCIKEMGEIKDLISKVVNSIGSLLALSSNISNGGNVESDIKNIKCYLTKFLAKIEVLEKKTEDCSSKILKARQAVLK